MNWENQYNYEQLKIKGETYTTYWIGKSSTKCVSKDRKDNLSQ